MAGATISTGGGHTSLSGLGNGGADDNDAQANRLVVEGVLGDVAHTLTSEGMDASEDGTGRGTPIIVSEGGVFVKTTRPHNKDEAEKWEPGEISPTLNTFDVGESRTNTLVTALTTRCGNTQDDAQVPQLLAFHATQDPISGDVSPALGREESGSVGVSNGASVRRLTPRECERLQGFPDDWTAVDGLPEYAQAKNGSWRCKKGTPDSKRYAAMGDAVTVNTVSWIARRIAEVASG